VKGEQEQFEEQSAKQNKNRLQLKKIYEIE
jgi:hypothetical protein